MSALIFELIRILQSLRIQFGQIAVYWAAGLVTGSLINVYLSDKIVAKISAFKDKQFNGAALFLFAALGIISPLCMYGTVPIIVSFGRKGVPEYLLAAFMICSILLNPNLFIMSLALGPKAAFLRLFVSAIGGIMAGALVYLFFKDKQLYRFDAFEVNEKKKTRVFWRDLLKAFRITMPYFFAGILITSLYDLYFPKDLMNTLFAGNKAFGTLFAMSLSVPLYTCGGGSIPLLIAWMNEGMSLGSALAFMTAGPATKFTNLGAVKIILGGRNFALYLVYCMGLAMISGFAADFLL